MAQPFKERIIFRHSSSSSSSSSSSAIQKTNNLQGLLLLLPPPPPPPPLASWKYNVFLSFRGEDTRDTFTDHLHRNLLQNGIVTFRDDSLTTGEEISPALVEAIEGSMISIIVFSENYASSKWCLDELVHILECKKSKQQTVIPVFYKVAPSDVRRQRGSFHQALATHEVRLQDKMDIVRRWRSALTEAGNMSGWTYSKGYETIFIDKIVKEISQLVLCRAISDGPNNLVGLESRVQKIIELVDLSTTPKARYVGIWGTVGIGKTTVAREVYKFISRMFEASFFLEDIAQKSVQQGSLDQQRSLLSTALGGKSKVLLILDNVTKSDQLRLLIGSRVFGSGSRIIITTRDKRLLTDYEVDGRYDLKELDDPDAFELFRANFAFQRREFPLDFVKLAEVALRYSQGFPLVLTVLGQYLGNAEEEDEWQQVLYGESKDRPQELHKKFLTSYNELEENEKKVFLDIACFLKGETKDHVIRILPGTDIEIRKNISLLEDRALLNVKADGCISMYNWLQDMGKETARQESTDPHEQRIRLCSHNEVSEVLTNGTGSTKIKGILVKFPEPNQVVLSASSFSGMKDLEIFVNNNAQFTGNINYLPDKLRLIVWPQFPFTSLPSTFVPKELVKLNMPDSCMSQLGTEFKSSRSLKYINLERCHNLEEIPNFSGFENLRDLNLDYCTGLVKIDDSVGLLKKLAELSLSGCESLVTFPSRIDLKSVKFINFKDCKSLKTLPEIMGEMKSLTWLNLSGTDIKELPSSIRNLISLLQLFLLGCKRLEKIPELPPKVEFVNAADCIQLKRYAELSNIMEHGKSQMIEQIKLFNCKRLCNSLFLYMAETKYEIPSPASLCSLFFSYRKSKYEVVFPESRVPQWFSHRKDVNQLTEKSEFSIPIPLNFRLENRGLAICAAVGRTNPEEPGSCSLMARISISEGGGIDTLCFSFEGKYMESVHVWLCFIPFVTLKCPKFSPFTCRVSMEQKSKGSLRCKSYGVHLVE